MNMKFKKVITMFLALALVFTSLVFTAEPVAAKSKKVKSKVYDKVYVTGKTAYCLAQAKVVKVNLKNNKAKVIYGDTDSVTNLKSMMKCGNYLYVIEECFGQNQLIRINIKKKKGKGIADNVEKYAFKKGKIYYTDLIEDDDTGALHKNNKVMKANGKNKKKSPVVAKMKSFKKNKKGYKIIAKEKTSYVYFYLKRPGRKKLIYLSKVVL